MPSVFKHADCPACGELTEVDFDLASVTFTSAVAAASPLTVGDFTVDWRPPTACTCQHSHGPTRPWSAAATGPPPHRG